MKKISLILSILLILSACAPAPAQTSEVFKTSEVLPTLTQTPEATAIPTPPELSGLPKGSYTLDADGLHIAAADSQTIDVPKSQIAERVKAGAEGSTIIVGDLIPNAAEKDSRQVVAYFDGTNWVVPDDSRNLRHTPELLQIKGESVPAVIEVVGVEGSMDPKSVSKSLREINIGQPSDLHFDGGDSQIVNLYHLTLIHKTAEKVTALAGGAGKETTIYQARLTFAYAANGQIHQVQFLVKNQMNESHSGQTLTEKLLNEVFLVGSRFNVNLRYIIDTPAFNRAGVISSEQKWCDGRGIGCYYNVSGESDVFYTYDELRKMLSNSSGVVIIEQGMVISDIKSDLTP